MRIAHLLPFPGVGGTEIGQVRIMRAARAAGHQSFALCLDPSPELTAYLAEQGVESYPCAPPQPSLKRGLRFLADSRRMAATLRDHSTQLVHCGDVLAAYHGALAGRLADLPVLCHVRSRRADLSKRDLLFIRQANHFAFVSKQTRRAFALPLPDARATILYDGIALPPALDAAQKTALRQDVLVEFGFPPETILVGMFGRIAPAKDYPTLIQAAALLQQQHPSLRILLVGDTSSNAATREHTVAVRASIHAAGLDGVVHLTGHRSDVTRLMQAINLFVLSSHSEGLPLVILEAMACGAPVVATAIDGVPEIIDDTVNGLLYPHADGEALANRMCRLFPGPEADEIAAAGRAHVAARFSEAVFTANVGALYQRLFRP